jgi:hypothetical protein
MGYDMDCLLMTNALLTTPCFALTAFVYASEIMYKPSPKENRESDGAGPNPGTGLNSGTGPNAVM